MRVSIIGAGRMGRRHVAVSRSLGLEVVGVTDRSEEALRATAEEAGLPEAALHGEVGEMLERTPAECVVVSTTAPSHADYVCAAAEAGARFILCEKPMATSLAECDRMIRVCRERGARLAVNHQMRFMEQYTSAKRIVESPAFGGLGSVLVAAGNFGLAMNGTHYFEMFRYLTDEAPARVTAWFSEGVVRNPRGAEYEDRAGSVRVSTASGKRLYLEAAADQGHGMTALYSGRHGQLLVDELAGAATLVVREEEHRALPTTRYGMPAVRESWAIDPADALAPTRAVLDALLNGRDVPTGEEGRLAVATLVAAYLSHEGGNVPVMVDDRVLPLEREFPWA